MSKVLVDRELLERITALLEWDGTDETTPLEFGAKCDSFCKELSDYIAQPAEAEGVEARLRTVIDELKAGFVVCQQCGDQEDTATLDCVPELEAIAAALSAVTAERDRLRKDRDACVEARVHYAGKLGEVMAERDQIRAELDELRKDAERYQWLKENVKHEFFGDQIVDLFTRSSQKIDRLVDAAMAAKEA